MSRSLLTPALFLNRDGIIHHEVGFLYRAQDVRFVEAIPLLPPLESL